MSCPRAHDDAAYVLGALSPADRLDYERHLDGCVDCTQAVSEMAGLPGLLGRVDPRLLEHPPVEDAVPVTLLPALSREVRRSRRRRLVGAAAAAAAAVAVAVPVAAVQLGDGEADPPASQGPAPSGAPDEVETRPMRPVGDAPVRARITLEQVTWGTRLGLTCTYDTGSVDYRLPAEMDYLLYVRTVDGRAERVGSWRSVDGVTMQLWAGTALDRDEIASVEVRAPDGRVVLTLAS